MSGLGSVLLFIRHQNNANRVAGQDKIRLLFAFSRPNKKGLRVTYRITEALYI
jgi:hypothetical protein